MRESTVTKTLLPLRRFWWLPVVGLVAAAAVAVVLRDRQPAPVYNATATVLVTSSSAPYLRTAQAQVATPSTTVKTKGKKGSTIKKAAIPAPTPPDTQVLVNAANLYPLMIQSDQIRKLRESLYGKVPGRVTANAYASSTNTYGVYHPSPLPVISVNATSRTPGAAEKLVDDTVKAFSTWVRTRQAAAKVPYSQRIAVEQLRVRTSTTKSSSLGMPAFAAIVAFLAFCGLALLADRIWPRRAAAAPITLDETAPVASHRRAV